MACLRPFSVTTAVSVASYSLTEREISEVDTPVDDGGLLRRCGRGDEDALEELVRRYEQRLYRVAFRVAGDRALAEEATVDSFYKVWCKARQWRGQSSPEAWIYRIAVRTTLDLMRGRQRWWRRMRIASMDRKTESTTEPLDELVDEEQRQHEVCRLERAISSLGESDRILVHLYYFEQRSLADIAPVLEASRDALKMRLARARKRLREALGESDDIHGT